MARTMVQLPADGTGKKLDAVSFTSPNGTDGTVYANTFVLCDASGNIVETIAGGAIPTGAERSLAVKQPGLTQQYGSLRVTPEPSGLFYDPLESLDANRWTTADTAPTFSNGQVVFSLGTTSNARSQLVSVPTFIQAPSVFLQTAYAVRMEAAAVSSGQRFWGLGTAPGVPTPAAPLTDAWGFEVGTDGKMRAVVYAAGTRTVVQDLSSASGNGYQPTDGGFHRYVLQSRSDRCYWFIDDMNVAVATASFTTPNVQQLPSRMQMLNGNPQGSAMTMQVQSHAITDTGHNNFQLSDGTYPFRKAAVSAAGAVSADVSDRAAREVGRVRLYDGTDEVTIVPARSAPASTEKALVTTKIPTRVPAYKVVTAEIAPAITVGVKDLFTLWHPSAITLDYYIVEIWVNSLITTASTAGRSTMLLQFVNSAPTGGGTPTAQPLLPGGTASGATVMSAKTGGGAATGAIFERREWLYATQPLGRVSEPLFQASSLEESINLPGGSAFGINVSEERVVAHTALVEQVTVSMKWIEL